jgi:hypothetical protein
MEQNMMNNNNNIFRYAFSAVLLFIAVLGFIIAYRADTVTLELSYTFISLAVTTVAISVLSKAVKDDINNLSGI